VDCDCTQVLLSALQGAAMGVVHCALAFALLALVVLLWAPVTDEVCVMHATRRREHLPYRVAAVLFASAARNASARVWSITARAAAPHSGDSQPGFDVPLFRVDCWHSNVDAGAVLRPLVPALPSVPPLCRRCRKLGPHLMSVAVHAYASAARHGDGTARRDGMASLPPSHYKRL
jgi:hypothetical protein